MVLKVAVLDQRIRAAGIPIDGVSGTTNTRIDFRPEATPEQRAAAQAIVDAWDQIAEEAAAAIQNTERQGAINAIRQARNALTAIDNELSGIDTATAVQVRGIVKNVLQRQRAIINALIYIAEEIA